MRFNFFSGLLSVGACVAFSLVPALSQNRTTVDVSTATPMPETGTYFVSNLASGEALQPNAPSSGQNVFLVPYIKSGVQKWVFTRQVDMKTHKPTDRYLIKLAGEDNSLVFQPHPVAGCTAIIQPDKSLFQLKTAPEGFIFKSVKLNGDCMCAVHVDDSPTEVHFLPDDGSARFRWKIDHAD